GVRRDLTGREPEIHAIQRRLGSADAVLELGPVAALRAISHVLQSAAGRDAIRVGVRGHAAQARDSAVEQAAQPERAAVGQDVAVAAKGPDVRARRDRVDTRRQPRRLLHARAAPDGAIAAVAEPFDALVEDAAIAMVLA